MRLLPLDGMEVPSCSDRPGDVPPSGHGDVRAGDACPVCRETSGWHDRYFFWFLHESYGDAGTLDALTRSLGFCADHGARAVCATADGSPLTFVHEVLVRRIGATLSRDIAIGLRGGRREAVLAVPDPCPACRSRDEDAGRAAFFLGEALRDAGGRGRGGLPALLCFPHLQGVALHLDPATLGRVLELHEGAVASAEGFLARAPDEEDAPREGPEGRLFRAVRLVAGEEEAPNAPESFPERPSHSGFRDPVGEFIPTLSRDDACPVCLEGRRAWTEWMAWLEDAVSRGREVEDLLPLCPKHVGRAARTGGDRLAVASVRKALSVVLDQVRLSLKALEPSPDPKGGRLGRRIRHILRGSGRSLQGAVPVLRRPVPCPVCHRLETARDRSLALLFALLEESGYRRCYESGHGLCLRHFSRALTLKPRDGIRTFLTEVEAAKLARLQWELEESMRKSAWMYRPETAGSECTAWKRAVHRFSGSSPEGAAWTG